MKSAQEFFISISETASWPEAIENDRAAAIKYLESMAKLIFAKLDASGAHGRHRDNTIFWEGMLKGVQLRLRRDAIREAQQLRESLNNAKLVEN